MVTSIGKLLSYYGSRFFGNNAQSRGIMIKGLDFDATY